MRNDLAWSLLPSLILVSTLAGAAEESSAPLRAVPDMDLKRYAGMWHEVARLPFRFQEQCTSDVTATYTLQPDGSVTVLNRCRTKTGEMSEARGTAKRASAGGPNTKLKVRFAPAWLSLLPAVWGDYWVIDLAPDYSYAVVGEPARRYLWILARTPSLDDATMEGVLDRIKENGYDPSRLLRSGAAPVSQRR
jgi:apolipoprotein D and lipocalin family protein